MVGLYLSVKTAFNNFIVPNGGGGGGLLRIYFNEGLNLD